jgi:hypothetical protein
MERDKEDTPILTEREARQGVNVRAQTLVLVLSLILGAVAAVSLYLWGPGSSIEVPAGGEGPGRAVPD